LKNLIRGFPTASKHFPNTVFMDISVHSIVLPSQPVKPFAAACVKVSICKRLQLSDSTGPVKLRPINEIIRDFATGL
jgi:hypothetical protein